MLFIMQLRRVVVVWLPRGIEHIVMRLRRGIKVFVQLR